MKKPALMLIVVLLSACASQQTGTRVAPPKTQPPAAAQGNPDLQKTAPAQQGLTQQGPAPDTLLQEALLSHDLAKLKDALARGANPNALVSRESWAITDQKTDNRVFPLFAVLDWYDIPTAQKKEALALLASSGADPRAVTPAGFSLVGAFISAASVTYLINGKPAESNADKLELLRTLLDLGADPNQGTFYQYILNDQTVTTTIAPLLRLEGYSIPVELKADIIRLLIQYHADPHSLWTSGQSGLERCLLTTSQGSLPLINAYLDAGVDPNAAELEALIYFSDSSSAGGSHDIAARMIARSSHLNDYDRYGKAFIHSAVGSYNQPEESIIKLIDLYAAAKGSDLSLPDEYGATPFMLAVSKNHPAIARELVRLGVDPRKPGPAGSTALHSIADENMKVEDAIALSDLVLSYGVDVNQRDLIGRTALALAADSDSKLDLIKHLVAKGADPAIPDIDGCTAMGTAKNMGNNKIVAYLTPLKVPSYSGGWPVGNAAAACKAVLGADIARVKKIPAADLEAKVARTADGVPSTPLHLAVESGNLSLIAALSAKPVNWNVGDRYGRTPLEIAVTQGRGMS